MKERMRKSRNMNLLLKTSLLFALPIILGIAVGRFAYVNNEEAVVMLLKTISKDIINILSFVTPFLVLCLSATAIYEMKCTKKEKLKKIYKLFKIIFITLIPLTAIVLTFSLIIIPHLTLEIVQSTEIEVYEKILITLKSPFGSFLGIILGFLIGFLIPKDNIIGKLIYKFQELILLFFKYIVSPILPFWILCSFSTVAYQGSSINLLLNDFILATITVSLQAAWLITMYSIVSKKIKVPLKKIYLSGLKIIGYVLTLFGNGGAIILPFIVKEQKKLNINEQDAKIVTATSFNMPGSVIANIICIVGVVSMTNMELSVIILVKMIFLIMLLTVIAPAVPGGTAALVTTVLTSYGFSSEQNAIYNTIYEQLGPFNASVNNAADIYISPYIE